MGRAAPEAGFPPSWEFWTIPGGGGTTLELHAWLPSVLLSCCQQKSTQVAKTLVSEVRLLPHSLVLEVCDLLFPVLISLSPSVQSIQQVWLRIILLRQIQCVRQLSGGNTMEYLWHPINENMQGILTPKTIRNQTLAPLSKGLPAIVPCKHKEDEWHICFCADLRLLI